MKLKPLKKGTPSTQKEDTQPTEYPSGLSVSKIYCYIRSFFIWLVNMKEWKDNKMELS